MLLDSSLFRTHKDTQTAVQSYREGRREDISVRDYLDTANCSLIVHRNSQHLKISIIERLLDPCNKNPISLGLYYTGYYDLKRSKGYRFSSSYTPPLMQKYIYNTNTSSHRDVFYYTLSRDVYLEGTYHQMSYIV